ncbi:hypothetical protein [Hymenobacter latericus]|uniref:hypothetical protein n=1 Tax=Hymenobacter sp. YIM 151858-1 TaxID=2987688 RepID=UPI002227A9C1|nr:hypothetical protein [Hymenobacter sp. YIM 151858-1]UYZ60070.1 hypothetical protein OIS50_04540 [Hymenobacter sp. YIM 151858-1]
MFINNTAEAINKALETGRISPVVIRFNAEQYNRPHILTATMTLAGQLYGRILRGNQDVYEPITAADVISQQ